LAEKWVGEIDSRPHSEFKVATTQVCQTSASELDYIDDHLSMFIMVSSVTWFQNTAMEIQLVQI